MSAWKKDLAGGAGRRQVIFQPWTPLPWPRDARPVRGEREAADAAAAGLVDEPAF